MSLVHGMSARPAARDWPELTLAALAPALAMYPALGGVRAMDWQSPRPFASSAIARCGAGQVFVKRHDARVRDVAALLEEHVFIAHLRARGAAVPLVHVTADGTTAVNIAGATWEVHALGDGVDRYRDAPSWTPVDTIDDAHAVGRALASLHQCAEGFTAPERQTRMLVASDALLRAADPLSPWADSDPALRDALAERPWREDARRVLLPWYAALGRDSEPPLWAHGDFHASNLLWRNGTVSAVLDFGLCNRASAAWDLATAIERNTIAWLDLSTHHTDIGRPDLAIALLQGYAATRPVPPRTPRILPVVHVEFALSELGYFHAITRSAANAEAAYTDFLLGHAAWFATPAGHAFLARLAAHC